MEELVVDAVLAHSQFDYNSLQQLLYDAAEKIATAPTWPENPAE